MAGLTATTDAIDAVFALLKLARDDAANGTSLLADVTDELAPGPLKDALTKVDTEAGQIPGELTDLSWVEGVELGQHVLAKVRELAA